MKSYLNLGCGSRFHPDWTNADFTSGDPSIISCNLRAGIPFPENSFDVVYHSHVLEHFARSEANAFLRECHRVLKKRGVIRIVVPDLESLARTYLHALEQASERDPQWEQNYEYLMLELFDQAVRDRPGGELGDYLKQEQIPNLDFVIAQGGVDARNIIEQARQLARHSVHAANENRVWQLPLRIYRYLRRIGFGREVMLRLILQKEYDALEVGRFRRRGEPHLWMYDRYSLLKTLRDAGFENPQLFSAAESQVPNWTDFCLDTETDGTVYKPYSLYAEAQK
ncbi:MAG TPA: methyltransferase domain-containing protein [Pyrinomonadaceae bacterium]|nr:methyltransferase domain-containing protein [Pyrinomonadaceae bacterium]